MNSVRRGDVGYVSCTGYRNNAKRKVVEKKPGTDLATTVGPGGMNNILKIKVRSSYVFCRTKGTRKRVVRTILHEGARSPGREAVHPISTWRTSRRLATTFCMAVQKVGCKRRVAREGLRRNADVNNYRVHSRVIVRPRSTDDGFSDCIFVICAPITVRQHYCNYRLLTLQCENRDDAVRCSN